MLKFHPVHFLVLLVPSNFRCSNLVAWIGGAAGSFWSVELAAEGLTRMRGLQPHDQSWHSSAGWLFPSWLFVDGIFFVREAQLAPPALHLQEDKGMELGEGAQLFPSPTPHCWGSSSTAQGRLWAAAWQRPWPSRWKPRLWLTLLKGDETLPTLAVAVEGSSEPSACLQHWTWGKKCAVSAC